MAANELGVVGGIVDFGLEHALGEVKAIVST